VTAKKRIIYRPTKKEIDWANFLQEEMQASVRDAEEMEQDAKTETPIRRNTQSRRNSQSPP
jgi:hypothetical protein